MNFPNADAAELDSLLADNRSQIRSIYASMNEADFEANLDFETWKPLIDFIRRQVGM